MLALFVFWRYLPLKEFLLSGIYCFTSLYLFNSNKSQGFIFCRCLIFKVRLSCPLSRVPCDYITSFLSCQALFLIFSDFFFTVFQRYQKSVSLFLALSNVTTLFRVCQELFLIFLHFFSDGPLSRDRSLKCLHIISHK